MTNIEAETTGRAIEKSFWIVGVLLLIWALIGCFMYWMEMTMSDAAYLETFGQEATRMRPLIPAWSVAGYAIGVWAGLVGAVLLLLKKRLALPAYVISFFGALIGWGWYVINSEAASMMATNGGWYMMIFVFVMCLFSIWWARKKAAQGLLT